MVFTAGQRLTAAALNAIVPQLCPVPANVPVNSTTPVTVTSGIVAAATYRVTGVLECVIGGTATAPGFRFDLSGSAAVSAMLVPFSIWQESNSGEQVFAGHLTSAGSLSSITATFGSASDVQVKFDGTITFSSGGTLTLSAAETTAAQPFTVSLASFMQLTRQVT